MLKNLTSYLKSWILILFSIFVLWLLLLKIHACFTDQWKVEKCLNATTKLSVDARMLKPCLSKLRGLCYFMIAHTLTFLCIKLVITKYELKSICLTDSIMTHICELCQNGFSVLSGRLIIMLSKICFLITCVDQWLEVEIKCFAQTSILQYFH